MIDFNRFEITECTEDDAALLEALEMKCFPEDPWDREMFLESLKNPSCRIFLLKNTMDVLAYGVLYTVLDEGDIANIATLPEYRRQGVGEYMLTEMINRAASLGTKKLFLEVRESNSPARRLYEKIGFTEIGIRKNYYESPRENAIVMTKGI